MSQTTASGAGGSAAPGWYTDPNNPSQLRWWSGEGWTDHVSPAAAPASPQQQQVVSPANPGEALPSRRALRDPAAEASEAAQAALQAQAAAQAQYEADSAAQAQLQAQQAAQAQQQAAQAQFDAQQQLEAQQAAQPLPAQPLPEQAQQAEVASQPSPPVPTLPVQPMSFLEQAGYPPLETTPSAPQAPGLPPQAAVPDQTAPAPSMPQQAAPEPSVPQPAPALPSQPVQPLQASAWDQAAQQANEYANMTASQSQWAQQAPPAQVPAPASPQAGTDGIDTLFPGAPAAAAAQGNWTPSAAAVAPTYGMPDQQAVQDQQYGNSADAVQQTAGSSTFWGWLIAISPILAAGAIGYVLVSTGYVLSGWPIEAAVAAPYVLVLLFALADRSALINLGHQSPRSPAWALLSAPVYLIMRASETRREDGSGTLLTLVWFFAVIVAIGGFVGYGFLTNHALIAGLPS